MRMCYIAIFTSVFLTFSFPAAAQNLFYYTYGPKKISLEPSPDKISLRLAGSATRADVFRVLSPFGSVERVEAVSAVSELYVATIKQASVRDVVSTLRNQPAVEIANPVYLIEGAEAVPYDHFLTRFRPSVSREEVEALNRRYGVEIVRVSSATPGLYTFRVTPNSNRSVLELAQVYYESLPSLYSLPDFIMEIEFLGDPSDTYYTYQYYLNNSNGVDIDAPEAWGITTGVDPVTVAVLDQGVSSHEDLDSNRLVSGYDAFGTSGGAPGGNESHGMAAAGIATAAHNGIGIAGVAPNVNVMPIRISDDYGESTTVNGVAQAIDHAWSNGADVLSNSWAYPSCEPNLHPQVVDALQNALTDGRGGYGSVVVFAAGNNANRSSGNNGCVQFPANGAGVLAVGAVSEAGGIQDYSPRDTELDLVAPSGGIGSSLPDELCSGEYHRKMELSGDVWTLDIAGSAGYSPGDYRTCPPYNYTEYVWQTLAGEPTPTDHYSSHFGGTSAAAPQVSGIAALMLSSAAATTISANAVADTIRSTATDMGVSGYDQDYGYGRANAYNALFSLRLKDIDIAGPTCLEPNESGTFSAQTVSGVKSLHYQWYYYSECNTLSTASTGPEPMGPSCGSWTAYGGDQEQISVSNDTDFQLKVEAWDATNTTVISSIHYVTIDPYNACGFAKSANGPDSSPADAGPASKKPSQFVLRDNYPNPFNPATKIRFGMPEVAHVRLVIHNVLGREVARLVDERRAAGYHQVTFNSGDLPSGVYIYTITAGSFTDSGRMVLLK